MLLHVACSFSACIELSRCLWSTMIMKRERLLYEENKYKNLEILVLKKAKEHCIS